MPTCGQIMKEIRLTLGLTQGELGEMIGHYRCQISDWEHDKHKPNLKTIRKIIEIGKRAGLKYTIMNMVGSNGK